MPPRGKEVPLPLRHAIVTLRLITQLEYAEIERKIGVPALTAAAMMRRAIQHAGNEDFHDVLACVGTAEGRGQKARVPEGGETSSDIRKAILRHPHMKQWEAVEKENLLDVPGQRIPRKRPQKRLSRSLIERVAHDHIHLTDKNEFIEEIVRGRVAKKPRLNGPHEEARVRFCHWALKELEDGAIFICSDEVYHEIGASSGAQKCSRPKGAFAENYSVPKEEIQFTIMEWHCMSNEVLMGPLYMWKAKTQKGKEEKNESRIMRKLEMQQDIDYKREQAAISNTPENEYWKKINKAITVHNAALHAERDRRGEKRSQKGTKRPRSIDQVYIYTKMESSGDGITGDKYATNILLGTDMLYDWCEAIQKRNPWKRVYLIEDNASAHTAAADALQEERRRRGIIKVNWCPNSPDLHPIEDLHEPEKALLKPRWKELKGASNLMKESARRSIQEVFYSPKMLEHAEKAFKRWPDKLKTCIARKGANNFKG
jgi:hypothetical protein